MVLLAYKTSRLDCPTKTLEALDCAWEQLQLAPCMCIEVVLAEWMCQLFQGTSRTTAIRLLKKCCLVSAGPPPPPMAVPCAWCSPAPQCGFGLIEQNAAPRAWQCAPQCTRAGCKHGAWFPLASGSKRGGGHLQVRVRGARPWRACATSADRSSGALAALPMERCLRTGTTEKSQLPAKNGCPPCR